MLEKPVGKVKTASNDADVASMVLRLSVDGQLGILNGFIARPPRELVVKGVKGSAEATE